MVESKAKKALIDTAQGCKTLCDDLRSFIESLKPRKKRAILRNVRMASMIVWKKDKVESLAHQLSTYRDQLQMQLLLYSNLQMRHGTSAIQAQLDSSEGDIIGAIYVVQQQQQELLHEIRAAQEERQLSSKGLTVTAMLTHDSGHLTTFSQRTLIDNSSLHGASVTTFGSPAHSNSSRFVAFDSDRLMHAQRAVLSRLFFEAIRSREYDIGSAYSDTFEWIYDYQIQGQCAWSSFPDWVLNGHGCYWVNGKAGSGKSTLMKFISDNPKQISLLRKWSKEDRLITASFYSWNFGSVLQRTFDGMLRSLLHDILSQIPELIPHVLPYYFQSAVQRVLGKVASLGEDTDERRFSDVHEHMLSELKRGLEILATQDVHALRIFILIDGIDEFQGNHAEISAFLTSLASDRFKVVISSRPIPVCVQEFAACEQLRLQDLTAGDMRKYAEIFLNRHQRFCEMREVNSSQCLKLLDDLVTKAEGVFLWTTLASASLKEGLDNYDSLRELQERLQELPPGLELLYKHMLAKLPSRYRHEASEIFKLVLQEKQLAERWPFNSILMSFALLIPNQRQQADMPHLLSERQLIARHKEVEGRLRSRCWGLVEVRADDMTLSIENILNSRIEFLHRTVADFLSAEEVQQDLILTSVSPGFDPTTRLAGACLQLFKANLTQLTLQQNLNIKRLSVEMCCIYCNSAEGNSSRLYHRVLDEMALYIDSHPTIRFDLIAIWQLLEENSQEAPFQTLITGWTFAILLACSFNLRSYLQERVRQVEGSTKRVEGQQVLIAMATKSNFIPDNLPNLRDLIRVCMPVDSQFHSQSFSPWVNLITNFSIRYFLGADSTAWHHIESFVNLVRIFVEFGADPDAVVGLNFGRQAPTVLALSFFELLLLYLETTRSEMSRHQFQEGPIFTNLTSLVEQMKAARHTALRTYGKRTSYRTQSTPDLISYSRATKYGLEGYAHGRSQGWPYKQPRLLWLDLND